MRDRGEETSARSIAIMKFTIMGTLPGLNEMTNAARTHWAAGHTQKRKATDLCRFWVNLAKMRPFSGPVKVHFDWYEPNMKRDPDNIRAGAKYIMDSLVEAQILPNDSQKWVKGLSDRFCVPDALKPRIEVEIIEV